MLDITAALNRKIERIDLLHAENTAPELPFFQRRLAMLADQAELDRLRLAQPRTLVPFGRLAGLR